MMVKKEELLNHHVTIYTMGGHKFKGLFISLHEGTFKIIDAWYNTMYIDETRIETISISAD